MTENEIKSAINKHSVKPLVGIILLVLILKILNTYLFKGDEISPLLIILFAIGACLHIFQKVLVDLFAFKKETGSDS